MKNPLTLKTGTLLAFALALAGCGSDSNDDSTLTGPTTPTSSFTQSATWAVALPVTATEADAVCYDIDAKATADCTGNTWDLKLKGGTRTGTLWTNSGTSASSSTSNGGTLGSPFAYSWTDLSTWTSATRMPGETADIPSVAWLKDSLKNVFTGSNSIGTAVFEYGVGGDNHKLWPTYRTFVITTDGSKAHKSSDNTDGVQVFALQVTGYYGGTSGTESGHVAFRFAEKTDADTFGAPLSGNVNASGSSWVYYDLVNNTVVDTPSGSNWHVAFNRYSIKLNQGSEVGTGGKVGGFVGKTPAGFYDASGNVVVSAFTSVTAAADTLADLTATDLALPANANAWIKDTFNSPLNPAYTGSYPNPLNYGWFTYYSLAADAATVGLGAAHMIKANDENGAMLRSSTGNSYARFRLKEIVYADNTNNSSQQTWTFEFDIQPAP